MHQQIGKLIEVVLFFMFISAVRAGWPMLQKIFSKDDVTVPAQEPPREIRGYVCCFCGEDIEETQNDPVYITTAFNYDKYRCDDRRGVLYSFAHWHCMYEHVQPSTKEALTYYYV